jgi:transposase
MLISGKSVKEVSETFGIAENLLYRWKTVSKMKAKAKSTESESVKLIAEITKLKTENAKLKTDREILKKALCLLSSSD